MNSDVYFSLGEAIAAVGIVIAIIGILRPSWWLNFNLNRRLRASVLSLLMLGLISAFVAFILSAYTENIFWANLLQGATYILFILAGVDFWRAIRWNKPLYKRKQSSKRKAQFVRHVLDEALFTHNEERLNALVTIVRNSMGEICQELQNTTPFDEDEERVGVYLLRVFLGEQKLARLIAEKRLDFIEVFIHELEKNKVGNDGIHWAVQSLLDELYTNPKSYLYQQVGYDGFTNYASIYTLIFENEYFVREQTPLQKWYGVGHRVNSADIADNSAYVQVFIKGFETSLKKFGYNNPALTPQMAHGMYRLADYAESISMGVRISHQDDYFAPPAQALKGILHFVSHTFYWDVFSKKAAAGQISVQELNPPDDTEQYSEGLSAAFCRLFVDCAEAIVTFYDGNDMERSQVLHLNEVFVNSIGSYAHVQGLRTKILHDLWSRSKDNIEHGGYPAVFRALAVMLYWRHNNPPTWAKQERNKLIDTLRNDLKPRIIRGELMANRRTLKQKALLPECIIFDAATGKFYDVDANDNRVEMRKIN
jgi:hypothetical protein